jgi:hypothetical protein
MVSARSLMLHCCVIPQSDRMWFVQLYWFEAALKIFSSRLPSSSHGRLHAESTAKKGAKKNHANLGNNRVQLDAISALSSDRESSATRSVLTFLLHQAILDGMDQLSHGCRHTLITCLVEWAADRLSENNLIIFIKSISWQSTALSELFQGQLEACELLTLEDMTVLPLIDPKSHYTPICFLSLEYIIPQSIFAIFSIF